MFASWYTPRPSDRLVARLLTERADDGVRAVIITGAPGVGKTSFARALAEGMGGRLIEYYAHHWTSDEDMFLAVDIRLQPNGAPAHPRHAQGAGALAR